MFPDATILNIALGTRFFKMMRLMFQCRSDWWKIIFSTWCVALNEVHGARLLFCDGHQDVAQTLDVISAVFQLHDGLVAARTDVAEILDGTHLSEYHPHLLRQKCLVDNAIDDEQFPGLRGHRTFLGHTDTTSWSSRLNALPLQHALLPGWVWRATVSRQDVATHQVLSCRGYKRRLGAADLKALWGYRHGSTAGLLAWATKDSE